MNEQPSLLNPQIGLSSPPAPTPITKPPIKFFVPGIPKTAGSKRAFMKPGMKFPIIVDDAGQAGKDWRGDIKRFASEYASLNLITSPLEVTFTFQMPRPKGHFGSGSNSQAVKASAPKVPTTKPDLLKMARAAEDALTGVIWVDDSQIVDEHLHKRYGAPGMWVEIRELE
ncbi:MAG TPA: RusA family crossover junction endodeoxyribonuclease [Candidatus Binatia bacterium]|nr:RusA family crossover junction endodeoxyribonuclease [Candidatus Binatia bacterium]